MFNSHRGSTDQAAIGPGCKSSQRSSSYTSPTPGPSASFRAYRCCLSSRYFTHPTRGSLGHSTPVCSSRRRHCGGKFIFIYVWAISLTSCFFFNRLDLSGNSLSGPIPASLSTHAALTNLYLRDNDFDGTFPELPQHVLAKEEASGGTGVDFTGAGRFACPVPGADAAYSTVSYFWLFLVIFGYFWLLW